jgi:hypothetical protein
MADAIVGAIFDLIYVSDPDGRTMSCAVRDSGGDHLIGPFPAKEAGPKMSRHCSAFLNLALRI